MTQGKSARMNRRSACGRLLGLAAGAPMAMSLLSRPNAKADWSNGQTVRVEEDWYVKIGTPSPNEDSPQISTVIAPSWTLWGYYAVFDMNCATQPNFESGGVQLQLWYDGVIVQSRSNTNWASLFNPNEEIRFTSAISIEDNQLVFEIKNGTSTSWGDFGNGEIRMSVPTWRQHLNWYSPWFSEQNSRIGFASHRVRRFIMERVRYFNESGEQSQETDPRILHTYDPID